MAEFEDKLNSILGNQAAMNQIMALARSLSGDQPPEQAPPPPDAPEDPDSQEVTYVPAEGQAPAGAPDLSSLLGQIDPKLLRTGMEIIRQTQGADDRSAALFNALRPFVKEERRGRLDRALQIARMTKLVRVALGSLGEEGERV